MNDFAYHIPKTVAEVITLLAKASVREEEVHLLAGGTVLVPQIKEGLARPNLVVNLKLISEFKAIVLEENHLHLGPLVTITELMHAPIIKEYYPVLAQAAATIAGVQIRNMGTVGGNLCNAAPTADLASPLIALQAVVQIQGPGGARSVRVDQFFTGPNQTVLQRDELVTGITIPRSAATASAIYIKHALRQAMAIAVVGIAIALRRHNGVCEDIRIALGAVAPTPLRALRAEEVLRGQALTDEIIATAAHLAAEEAQPDDDVRGSAWYRRRMVRVLTRRALRQIKDER